MHATHYIAVSMEMTADGPEFHMITNSDPDAFKAEYAEMPGDVFINQSKTIHYAEGAVASSVDNSKVLKVVADAIAEVKRHRGSYMSTKEAEDIFKHLRIIRDEASK